MPHPIPTRPLPPLVALLAALLAAALAAPAAAAQDPLASYADAFEPQYDPAQPVVRYDVRVDSTDLQGYAVTMHVANAPDSVVLRLPAWAPGAYRLADFAQYVGGLAATDTADRPLAMRAEPDSARWTVRTPGGAATVRYRIRYPSAGAARTPNNRGFLQPTGGLIDGPITYLYVEGQKLVPSHVTFDLPASWRIATGLAPTADPRTFHAPSYDVLIDSPVLLGDLRRWRFSVDGVPHTVAYWPLPDAVPFDTAAFVAGIRRGVEGTRDVWGRLPYREYAFLFVDGTGGGLEHLNSTTIGAPSASLARDPNARIGTTIHEFVHTWNVKRLRPAGLGPFDYQRPVRSTGLWWSEGVTDYFADYIARKEGFVTETQARDALAASIESYLGNPAHRVVSPERASWTAWDPPAANDGYAISYYLQGLLLGELLDVAIRDSTDGRRGMPDVARHLYARYAGAEGFRGEDLVRAVNAVCACDLQPFFERHVSSAEPIDFDRWLRSLGWRTVVTRGPATDERGAPAPDLRIGVTGFAGIGSAGGVAGSRPKLSLSDPTSTWGRAGLRGGEFVVAVNGRPVRDAATFRAALGAPAIGDSVRVTVLRGGRELTVPVVVGGYDAVDVRIEELPTVTPNMRARRAAWMGR